MPSLNRIITNLSYSQTTINIIEQLDSWLGTAASLLSKTQQKELAQALRDYLGPTPSVAFIDEDAEYQYNERMMLYHTEQCLRLRPEKP